MIRVLALILFLFALLFDGDTLGSGIASLVITFFGLLATAILPALSLLVANTLAPGLSVAQTQNLHQKLERLINRLVEILGMLLVGALGVIIHQIGLPELTTLNAHVWYSELFMWLPALFEPLKDCISLLVQELPARAVQALIFVCVCLCLDRTRIVPSAFRQVLKASYELAVTDSQKRLLVAAPSAEQIRTDFQTSPNFGTSVKRGTSDTTGATTESEES